MPGNESLKCGAMPQHKVVLKQSALFFDFDGTLVELAPTPDAVVVPTNVRRLIQNLSNETDGAVAIITGRNLGSLDSLLNLPDIAASGSHGGEWRQFGSEISTLPAHYLLPDNLATSLTELAHRHQLIFENKRFSIAIHFRDKPHLEDGLSTELEQILKAYPSFLIQDGKMVREIKHQNIHKGAAIARFMECNPFRHKTAVFFGDDVTDEYGFDWVNHHGGISIKIGNGPTQAQHRLASINELTQWLFQLYETGEIFL